LQALATAKTNETKLTYFASRAINIVRTKSKDNEKHLKNLNNVLKVSFAWIGPELQRPNSIIKQLNLS